MKHSKKLLGLSAAVALLVSQGVMAHCSDIPYATLKSAADTAASLPAGTTGGYGLNMWVTVVDETGLVCGVYVTGGTNGALAGNSAWLGSRVISAQKANTANAFSLDGYAISTANLYSAVQPGGSLFGLQASNPVDSSIAYGGSPTTYGTANDFLVNKRIGGVNVFGGGLALYKSGKKVGAVGVSGDTSCRDHAFAWRVRSNLGMLPTTGITNTNVDASGAGQTPLTTGLAGDEMIISSTGTGYWKAWSHPACPNSIGSSATIANGQVIY